ncbi:hypothetical protein ABDK09_04385 [Vibrio sp. CDRSL-10 TSBA]
MVRLTEKSLAIVEQYAEIAAGVLHDAQQGREQSETANQQATVVGGD